MTAADRRAFDRGRRDALAGRDPDPDGNKGASDEFAYDRGYQAGLDDEDDPSPAAERDASPRARRDRSRRTAPGPKRRTSTSSKRRRSTSSRAARQIARPVARSAANAVGAVGGAVALAFLYNALQNTEAAGGFVGGLGRVVEWLDDPTKPIPYRTT